MISIVQRVYFVLVLLYDDDVRHDGILKIQYALCAEDLDCEL
jgi:hypothetical protein